MEKLYYHNQYEKTFTAEVLEVIEKNNEFHIKLDKTYFYPEGGGAPSDTGTIEASPINYVYEENGDVYHVSSVKPIKIHRVKCSIDWKRRFDIMQQHLGQHILSASFSKLFNASTIGFHLGESICTIDINKFFTKDQIDEAENLSNSLILDNITVEFLYPTKSELKKMPIKKISPKINEQIRVVKIGDIDFNPCCGLHPKSTIEVQLIKILKWEKYKNSTRIHFLCGERAIKESLQKYIFSTEICSLLKCSEAEAIDQIQKQRDELNKILAENRLLKDKISNYEIKDILEESEKISGITVVKKTYSSESLKYINTLATKLTAFNDVITLFAVKDQEKANLIFSCSKNINFISMNLLLKDAISLIDGKGGGSTFSAQGGGKNTNNLDSTLDYAFMKIKNTLNENK